MPAPIPCDPDNPRDEDISYANAYKGKVWGWICDRYLSSPLSSTKTSFSLSDAKVHFTVQSIELLTIILNMLIESGKIFKSSGPRSRIIEYTITDVGISELKCKECEIREAEEAAKQEAKEQDKARKKVEALKQKQRRKEGDAANMEYPAKFSGDSNVGSASSGGAKRAFQAFQDKDKENRQRNEHDAENNKKAKHSAENSMRSKSASATKSVDASPPRPCKVRTIVLETSPDLGCMKQRGQEAPLKPEMMEAITEVILLLNDDGNGTSVQSVYEAAGLSGVSVAEFNEALEHLSTMNRIMVDWDMSDKQRSTIYQL